LKLVAPEDVYVNDSEVELVGFAFGDALIDGVAGPPAANATAAQTPAATTGRTASNATSGLRLALPDTLLNNLPVT
jgi:hypothetical protein